MIRRSAIPAVWILVCIVVLAGWNCLPAGLNQTESGDEPPATPPPVPAAVPVPSVRAGEIPTRDQYQQQLLADLKAAIETLETSDYTTFIEWYAPLEEYRDARDSVERMNAYAAEIARPERRKQLLDVLRAAQSAEIFFEDGHSVASFQADVELDSQAAGAIVVQPLNELDDVQGWEGGLDEFLAQAIKLLENPDAEAQTFFAHVLPRSELARWDQHPVERQFAVANWSMLRPAMLADFQSMRKLSPRLSSDGRTAVFQIIQEPVAAGRRELVQPGPREVRLQFDGRFWRFFDQTTDVRATQVEVAGNLGASVTVSLKIRMERFGDHWRLMQTYQ